MAAAPTAAEEETPTIDEAALGVKAEEEDGGDTEPVEDEEARCSRCGNMVSRRVFERGLASPCFFHEEQAVFAKGERNAGSVPSASDLSSSARASTVRFPCCDATYKIGGGRRYMSRGPSPYTVPRGCQSGDHELPWSRARAIKPARGG